MDKLILKLRDLAAKNPLDEKFNWRIPQGCPIEIPEEIGSAYSKNVFLKENLYKVLALSNLKNYYWIIQEWGGISAFSLKASNDRRIQKFFTELTAKNLSHDSFSCISSLSKVAAFSNPSEYAIYDSRVIYSLNWLIFNYASSVELYPQPVSRNSTITEYDPQTIYKLNGKKFAVKESKKAYFDYCDFLKKATQIVYGEAGKIYMLEMLLFIVAITDIANELKHSVSVNITLPGSCSR